MTSDNYFSIVAPKPNPIRVYPFAESSPTGLQDAFLNALSACSTGELIAVWHMPERVGPWSRCEIVGYRSEQAILHELETAADADDTILLLDELAARRLISGAQLHDG